MSHRILWKTRRALWDSQGSVAVVSALIIPVLVLLLFMSIDMGRSYLVKVRVQEAIDAALVAAIASKDTQDFEEEFAQVFAANVRANYAGANITNVEVVDTSSEEDVENNVTVFDASGNITVPVSYLGITDGSPIEFSVTSQVKIGTNTDRQLELALVLDNSGSMAGGKMTSLKSAAGSLVSIVFGKQEESDNLNISIIPYDVVVNIGPNRQSWIQANSLDRYNAQSPGFASNRRSNFMCAFEVVVPGGEGDSYRAVPDCSSCTATERCRAATGACTVYPPDPNRMCNNCTGNAEVGFSCSLVACPYPGYTYCDTISYCISRVPYAGYSYWWTTAAIPATNTPAGASGCVNNSLIDADDTPPTAGDNWRFRLPYSEARSVAPSSIYNVTTDQYAYLGGRTLAPILFSSNRLRAVQGAIQRMQVHGATRSHVGLMWGWFTLSPKWQGLWDPSRPSLPKTPDPENLDKVIVLMTDGRNTFNEDGVMLEVCDAIKASGITIYTVGFGSRADIDESLLQACATQEANYFYAPDADALEDSFRQIGGAILYPTIRLTK